MVKLHACSPLSGNYKSRRETTELSSILLCSQLKVIGLPSEVGDNLMGQPDHLEMESCAAVSGETRRFKVIGLPSESCFSADNPIA